MCMKWPKRSKTVKSYLENGLPAWNLTDREATRLRVQQCKIERAVYPLTLRFMA